MRKLRHKYQQISFKALKLALLIGICFYIYFKLKAGLGKQDINIESILSLKIVFTLVILTSINWLLEVKKWKVLISSFQKTTFKTAFNQVFSAHAISILTPNRLGEYGAKSLFFQKSYWKRIVFLNLLGNSAQLLSTLLFGLIGAYFFFYRGFSVAWFNWKSASILFFALLLGGIIAWQFSTFQNYFFRLEKAFLQVKSVLKLKIIGLSAMRYLVFSHQFFFLLYLLENGEVAYFPILSGIFLVYLIASFLPSIFLLDAVVKGGVGIFIFSFYGIAEVNVVLTTLIIWLFNFGLPAVVGSVFIANSKIYHYKLFQK